MNLSRPDQVNDLRGLFHHKIANHTKDLSEEEKLKRVEEFVEMLEWIKEQRELKETFTNDWEFYKNSLSIVWIITLHMDKIEICVRVLEKVRDCISRNESSTGCQEFWFLYRMVLVMTCLKFSRKRIAKKTLKRCKKMFDKTQPETALNKTLRIALYFIYYMYFKDIGDKDRAALNGVNYLKYSYEYGNFEITTWIADLCTIGTLDCIAAGRFRQAHYLLRVANLVAFKYAKEPNVFSRCTIKFYFMALDHITEYLSVIETYAENTIKKTGQLSFDYVDELVKPNDERITIEGFEGITCKEPLERIPRTREDVLEVCKLAMERLDYVKSKYVEADIKKAEKHLDAIKKLFSID